MINIKRHKNNLLSFVCILMLTISTMHIEAYSAGEPPQVMTITNNVLTSESSSTISGQQLLYSGSPYTATSAAEFKAALNDAISNCSSTATISYTGATSLGALGTILNAYVKEVMQTAGNDYEKTLLYKWSISYTSTLPQFTATFTFNYLETAEQRAQVASKINEVLASIITVGMSEEQKEKAIHDYIITTVAYDKTLVNHSAYAGIFGYQKTVCQGYALLAYKMLTSAGLEARIITGKAGTVAHAWNLVKLNGVWYQIDFTWDDPVPDVIGRIRYDYYNLTDSQMLSKTHTWTATYYPAATTQYVTTDAAILAGGAQSNMPTTPIDSSNITVVNNMTGKVDTVSVIGVKTGQTIKLYKDQVTTVPLATKVVAINTTGAAFTVSQLGVNAGSIYVSLIGINSTESARTKVDYLEETKTNPPTGLITENNVDTTYKDTIMITNAAPKAILKAYKDSTKTVAFGTATVTAGGVAIIKLAATKFQTEGGSVYVTLKEYGIHESLGTTVAYDAEVRTVTTSAISVYNLTNIADVLSVKGLVAGDTIKAYTQETGGTVLATTKVKTGKTSAAVNIKLNGLGGTIWVTVKSINKLESFRVRFDYLGEE